MIRDSTRRAFVGVAGAAVGSALLAPHMLPPRTWLRDRRRPCSRVAILSVASYGEGLEDALVRGFMLFGLGINGRSVLLKPNLVESIPGAEVNTNPLLVGAATDAFLRLGAERVVIAEGPGHQRDTYLVLVESGLAEQLWLRGIEFVDLNRDALVKVRTRSDYSGLKHRSRG